MSQHFLVKSEPDVYPWERLVRDGKTRWDGVRNFGARNNLRAMKKGDLVLFYHSNEGKAVVGIAKVVREAFAEPVTLALIKSDKALASMQLVKRGRLSVSVVTAAEFDRVVKLSVARR